MQNSRLSSSFFLSDVLEVAPALVGKKLVRCFDNGEIRSYRITETEAYRGEEDQSCHARRGRTQRNRIMYHEGGVVYVYFIYGMYWMLNFVSSEKDFPSAVLIRGIEGFDGPGKVGRELKLDASFYGESLLNSKRIWVETASGPVQYACSPRIGINYAGEEWMRKPWRFSLIRTTNR